MSPDTQPTAPTAPDDELIRGALGALLGYTTPAAVALRSSLHGALQRHAQLGYCDDALPGFGCPAEHAAGLIVQVVP